MFPLLRFRRRRRGHNPDRRRGKLRIEQQNSTMSRSTDPDHFFQTDAAESARARKAAKSGNKNGDPIPLPSKVLNVISDPRSPATSIYIAESAGNVRRVNVQVSTGDEIYVIRAALTPMLCRQTTSNPYIKARTRRSRRLQLAAREEGSSSRDAGIKIFGAGRRRAEHARGITKATRTS